MKKLISLLSIAMLFAVTVYGQSSTPRTGTSPNQDNTYRVFDYKFVSPNKDAAGLDTITLNPYAYHTQVFFDSLVDSVALSIASTTNSYLGDELEIQVVNSSTGKVIRWAGSTWATSTVTIGSQNGAMYLTASKRAVIVYHFDGTKWVEVSRMVQ